MADLSKALSIEDLRRIAKRRLPRAIFDFFDGGAEEDLPPLALPKREYMERAKKIWEELGLPKLRPQPPWFGYSLGDWLPQWDEAARRAVEGRYLDNGTISEKQRKQGVKPETKFRPE